MSNTLESKKLWQCLLLPESVRLGILALSQLACLLSDPVSAWFPRCLGSVTTKWTSADCCCSQTESLLKLWISQYLHPKWHFLLIWLVACSWKVSGSFRKRSIPYLFFAASPFSHYKIKKRIQIGKLSCNRS